MARFSAILKPSRLDVVRLLAAVYAALFISVVVVGYLPGLTNAEGQLLGLFKIDPIDDALHLGSGIWAALAAWHSTRAAIFYFRAFGVIYFLDGLLGLLTGQGYLDGGIFVHGYTPLDWGTKIAANLPHLAIGGIAALIGFVLSRRFARDA